MVEQRAEEAKAGERGGGEEAEKGGGRGASASRLGEERGDGRAAGGAPWGAAKPLCKLIRARAKG